MYGILTNRTKFEDDRSKKNKNNKGTKDKYSPFLGEWKTYREDEMFEKNVEKERKPFSNVSPINELSIPKININKKRISNRFGKKFQINIAAKKHKDDSSKEKKKKKERVSIYDNFPFDINESPPPEKKKKKKVKTVNNSINSACNTINDGVFKKPKERKSKYFSFYNNNNSINQNETIPKYFKLNNRYNRNNINRYRNRNKSKEWERRSSPGFVYGSRTYNRQNNWNKKLEEEEEEEEEEKYSNIFSGLNNPVGRNKCYMCSALSCIKGSMSDFIKSKITKSTKKKTVTNVDSVYRLFNTFHYYLKDRKYNDYYHFFDSIKRYEKEVKKETRFSTNNTEDASEFLLFIFDIFDSYLFPKGSFQKATLLTLKYQFQCSNCNYYSEKSEDLRPISLIIPQEDNLFLIPKNERNFSIQSLLKKNIESSNSDDEILKICDNNCSNNKSIKHYKRNNKIKKCPKFLYITLRRFIKSYDKKKKILKFKKNRLSVNINSTITLKEHDENQINTVTYTLTSLILHDGKRIDGKNNEHYRSIIRIDRDYYLYDDDKKPKKIDDINHEYFYGINIRKQVYALIYNRESRVKRTFNDTTSNNDSFFEYGNDDSNYGEKKVERGVEFATDDAYDEFIKQENKKRKIN